MLEALEGGEPVGWKKAAHPAGVESHGPGDARSSPPALWREHARRRGAVRRRCPDPGGAGLRDLPGDRPGSTLLGMAGQVLAGTPGAWLPSLSRQKPDWHVLLESLQALYLRGLPINWEEVHRERGSRRVPLPPYPFQRKRLGRRDVAPRRHPRCERPGGAGGTSARAGRQLSRLALHAALAGASAIATSDRRRSRSVALARVRRRQRPRRWARPFKAVAIIARSLDPKRRSSSAG